MSLLNDVINKLFIVCKFNKNIGWKLHLAVKLLFEIDVKKTQTFLDNEKNKLATLFVILLQIYFHLFFTPCFTLY